MIKLTLKQKLITTSLTAVLIMAAALTWLSADQLEQQTQRGVVARAQAISETASKGISDWINIRKAIASAFNDYATETDRVPFLQQARKAGGFDDIFFGSVDGDMYRSHPDRNRADYDPRTRLWYRDAMNAGRQIITTAYQDAITNELLVTLAEPVSTHGQRIGVVGADVLIDKLINDVLSINAGENAYTMLIDTQNGAFLAHSNKALLLQPVSAFNRGLTMDVIQQASARQQLLALNHQGQEQLFYFVRVADTPWVFAVQMDKKTEFASHSQLLTGLLTTALVITLLVVFVVSWLVSLLFKDLARVSHALEEIATGDGDLTQRLEPRSDDEVGQLARNFNIFVSNMHSMVRNLSEVSASLSAQSQMTAAHAEERSARISIQQDEINMVATAINEMAAATQEIANNSEHTAHNASESVTACAEGTKQVSQTQTSIHSLAEEVQLATNVIQELEEHGNQISTILATIQGIAEQTNLLALNAAIEAARAGEQGRGFAVVADEVRMLSQRTQASTTEIQTMIDMLQTTTGKAVSIMNDSRSLADTSVDDANSAAASLLQIHQAVADISDMAAQIATAAEEQASVTSEITRNTVGIRDVSNDLAQEAHEAAAQAAELSQLSYQLDQEIRRFKL